MIMKGNKMKINTTMRWISFIKFLFVTAGIILVSNPVFGGSFSIEAGLNYGQEPKGNYIENMSYFKRADSGRIGLRYIFDSGLSIGREAYSQAFDTREDEDRLLVITYGGFTLGWAWEGMFRSIVEIAIPEQGTVSIREKFFEGDADRLGYIDAIWFGYAADFGDEGLGAIASVRYVSSKTEDLFNADQELDASGFYWGLGLRYLW